MTRRLAPAKTPGVAIARVLRGIGLKQGTDFRVTKGTAINGCTVSILTELGHDRVATFENTIEVRSEAEGFLFRASVYTVPTGAVRTSISNIKRVQLVSAAPLDDLIDLTDEVNAEQSARVTKAQPVQDELPRVGAYLDGLSNALDARGQRHARLVAAWPSGTRVSGPDSRGVMRTGTVYGGDHGEVADRTHHNHGRTYVGVWWDESSDSTIPRSRPFTDELTKI